MEDRTLVETTITVDGEKWTLIGCSIREPICEVPAAHAEIAVVDRTSPMPEASSMIGKTAILTIKQKSGSERQFVGVVVEAERFRPQGNDRSQMADAQHRMRLTIAPRLWKLQKRADCRTFQNMKPQDIVKKVLDEASVPNEMQIVGDHDLRKYVVQYRETDFDFVQRLCFEEGIYFVVKHDGDDKVHFCDDPSGIKDIDGTKNLPFVLETGFVAKPDCVGKVREASRVTSGKVYVRDYFFEKPKVKVEATQPGKDGTTQDLEVYVYPARAEDSGQATKIAQRLMESIQHDRKVVEGDASTITLRPGERFQVEEHPYAPLNQEYIVVLSQIEWWAERHQVQDSADFTAQNKNFGRYSFMAVPTKNNALRPPRRAPTQTCVGLQTAWTTGPAGQEIYVDKHQRVKSKFHWDRLGKEDDTSSDSIRTWQPPTSQITFNPRVAWEVSEVYNEGDVDRPYCMQRFYNAIKMPPYKLPDNKVRSCIQTDTTPHDGTSNELFRYDDTKGKEEMYLHASKDMSIDVNNNTTESVGNNETHKIGSNHKLNVTDSHTGFVRGNQSLSVSANQTIEVSSQRIDDVKGNHTKSVGGSRTMHIGGDHKITVGGSSSTSVGGTSIELVVGGVSDSTSGATSNTVGGAQVDVAAGSQSVVVGGMRSEKVGAVKVVVTKGGRGVEVKGVLTHMVGGAVINKVKGDKTENAGASYSEVAAGASIIKADNVTFEAEGMISLVMGASTVIITPASVSILGSAVKLDGATLEQAPLITNN